jgi:hypothetical protein
MFLGQAIYVLGPLHLRSWMRHPNFLARVTKPRVFWMLYLNAESMTVTLESACFSRSIKAEVC